ncbi:hypothetical protein BI364_06685 [Acidihalobacter yilgarnensis]|uniref:Uncharacterized protein n=1 Tax=Acidihalobacter yilgarnensis TaxID=2819280 RepID=A0A1D8IMN5_9GAMM|nr:hypothetical protein BI364_06685 [Acidihalobacter yilgarnensis]
MASLRQGFREALPNGMGAGSLESIDQICRTIGAVSAIVAATAAVAFPSLQDNARRAGTEPVQFPVVCCAGWLCGLTRQHFLRLA